MDEMLGLSDMAWFAKLPAEVLAPIEAGLLCRHFKQGELILARGEPGSSVLFVIEGRVFAVHWTEGGREIIYSDMGPGSAFGEMSVLSGGPRSLSLYARTDCTLYEMPGKQLLALIDTHREVREALMATLVKRVQQLTERVQELTSLGVEERLRAYLLRLALEQGKLDHGQELADLPTHAEIANIIGANREAVSRGLAKLGREGVIEAGRKFLRILRPDALYNSAEE